jgi:hypothetical protein
MAGSQTMVYNSVARSASSAASVTPRESVASVKGPYVDQHLIRRFIMIESNALFAKIKDCQNRTQVLRGYL